MSGVLAATSIVSAGSWRQKPARGVTPQVEWMRAQRNILDDVQSGLRSDDARRVAWGAFRAGEYRLQSVSVDVVHRLTAPPAAQGEDQFALRAALMDSAVRLDAAVPAKVLKSYWLEFPVQSSILFAKSTGQRDETLLELLPSSREFRWFALANLLLQARPPGFAAAVLTPLRLQLTVIVSDVGHSWWGGGGDGARGVGDGIGLSPAGFPPRATYRFEAGPMPGYSVLSVGPRTIYYSRSVSYDWQFGRSDVYIGGPTGADRLLYISALTGSDNPETTRRIGDRRESVHWRGGDDLRRQIDGFRADMLDAYRRYAAELVAARQIKPSDVAALDHPPIDVRLVDARTIQTEPLPPIK